MIGARRYNKDTDFQDVTSWWLLHDQIPPLPAMYPETGFIVENVAAAFLFRTDSSMALIEMIIYNPETPKDIRQKALNEVIESVILEAASLGYETLSGFTDMGVVIERAKSFGFTEVKNKYTMIVKGIS